MPTWVGRLRQCLGSRWLTRADEIYSYVWGGFGVIATIWVFFFVPELKGRTLEEIVWMFDRKVPLREMGSTEIPGDTLPITVTPASQEVEALDKKETELRASGQLSRLVGRRCFGLEDVCARKLDVS
jgi:hypothetical protein